ncbi:MAG: tetratricopeptide repeat protein [Deltaproteobacteria bacterium]|nr:tetratricopeptide repeat protein [Deltaproteobacteria bacterium]
MREAWEIQAGWWSGLGLEAEHARVFAALKRLKPVAREPEPPGPMALKPPAANDGGFVSATSIRLRARADARARIEAELPINTAVTVLKVDSDWAEVRGEVPPLKELIFDGPPMTGAPTPFHGFLMWKYLSRDKLTPARLVTQAAEEEAAGRPLEASRLLERAMVLNPLNDSIRKALARTATAAGQFDLAMRAALPLASIGERDAVEPWNTRSSATTLDACTGQRALMSTLHGPSLNPPAVKDEVLNGCVVNSARPACEPPDASPERAAWEKSRKAQNARSSAINQVFSDAGWARLVVPPPQRVQGKTAFAYALPYSKTCELPLSVHPDGVRVSTTGWTPTAGDESTTIWVRPPSSQDTLIGLVWATSPETAKAAILEHVRSYSGKVGPRRNLPPPVAVTPPSSCECVPPPPGAPLLPLASARLLSNVYKWRMADKEDVFMVDDNDQDTVWLNVGGTELPFGRIDGVHPPKTRRPQAGTRWWTLFEHSGQELRIEYRLISVGDGDDCSVTTTEASLTLKRGGPAQTLKLVETHGC